MAEQQLVSGANLYPAISVSGQTPPALRQNHVFDPSNGISITLTDVPASNQTTVGVSISGTISGVIFNNPTLSGTVSGAPVWASSQAITLSTAAQPNVTSLGTLTGLTVTAAPTFSSMTAGSVLFAGAGGLLSQDNANLFWDDTNNRLGIGTASPGRALHVQTGTITGGTGVAGTVFITAGNSARGGILISDSNTASLWLLAGNSTTPVIGWDTFDLVFKSAVVYSGGPDTSGIERVRITTAGNIKLAGTAARATTEGTNHLDIFDGTAPVGTLTGGISLYSTAGELRVMDSAGNATLLSPHDRDGSWIYDSVSPITRKHLRVDMERMVKFLNDHFGADWVQEVAA